VIEDNHLDWTRDAGLFVLADGAGGAAAGEVASYIATTVIVDELSDLLTTLVAHTPEDVGIDLGPLADSTGGSDGAGAGLEADLSFVKPSSDEIETALEEAVEAAQQAIRTYAAETGTDLHTTVVAGVYNDGRFRYAWTGDSRAYVLNTERGRFESLTRDYSRVREQEDDDLIDETEAMVHPDRNRITNALGLPDADVIVDTGDVKLYRGDVLLLTSDGLIDAYPSLSAPARGVRQRRRLPEVQSGRKDRKLCRDRRRDRGDLVDESR
jgi:serine/threonine protein phosphatase PrpC